MALEGESPRRAFWLSYLCGVVFFAGTVYWVGCVTYTGLVALVLYLALYFGIFGFFTNHASRDTRYGIFILPALWVALEFIRSHALTGFGWALLGYSQYKVLPIIQIADIFGAYGVSFLILMANAAIYQALSKKRFTAYSLKLTAFLILAALSYGYLKLHHDFGGSAIRVSVVQGNIPQQEKWDEKYKDSIVEKYSLLTKLASKDGPDIIIWPETSAPGLFNADEELRAKIVNLVKDINTPLLIGAATSSAANADTYFNSALLFSGDGDLIGQYNKLHLVPFGEFIPFEGALPFLRAGRLQEAGAFSRGWEYTVFGFSSPRCEFQFSTLICFEDIFPDLVRTFVNNGADFLVNITNDAWFGKTAEPYQHAQASVFRAVENRVEVVRAANTGLSCFIDRHGRIYESVRDSLAGETFVSGYATAQVHIKHAPTMYKKFGDLFALACFFITGTLVVIKKRKT